MTTGTEEPPERYGEVWAAVYDEKYAPQVPPREDQLDFLAGLAAGGSALELAIGTGRIALPLAARGVDVRGIDASHAMVERLRAKPGGAHIPVTIGDMADVQVEGRFRLTYLLVDTLFLLPTQDRQVDCFRNVARVLEPGGTFVIECAVPDIGRFDRGQTLRTESVSATDLHIEGSRHYPLTQQVICQFALISTAGIQLLPVRLRYAWPSELDLMARIAGLRLRERWGSWSRAPLTETSRGHVSVYELAGPPTE